MGIGGFHNFKEKTLEEVAQQYLTELMNRSLVQVSKVNYRGKPKECHIHDLLRDMTLRKMEDLRFGSMLIFSSDFLNVTDLCETTFCAKFKLLKEVESHQISRLRKLRYLFVFGGETGQTGGLKLVNRFGCLALQNLYNVQISDEIEELKKLTQLRKLGISCLQTTHEWSVVCDCINEMKHLQSLLVYGLGIVDLDSFSSPPEFLQSLLLEIPLRMLPKWIPKLQNLAKFEIRLSRLEDNVPLEVLQNLPNLVVLIMASFAYVGEKLLFKHRMFQKLKHLQLELMSDLNSLVIGKGALPTLERLIISRCYNLTEVPRGIQRLRKLKKLTLPIWFKDSEKPAEGEEDYHIALGCRQLIPLLSQAASCVDSQVLDIKCELTNKPFNVSLQAEADESDTSRDVVWCGVKSCVEQVRGV
ncbi:hypothetical protein FNV43_RR00118 [Rhamnella rubrinervis]|uniref:Uncharacterized protein n=1 Tax=Rhamnella rubrinervis TaxID=2594499 RepID=A0A8K0HQ05_9ROSA|nr:hypothetical protein FNV43_RR00118 [Rhamnella rubrinervis]